MKRKWPRLERPKKQYDLADSALYGIRGFNQLLSVLLWDGPRGELEKLCSQRDSYSTFTNEDGRVCQAASPALRRIHTRIATLLRRIEPPFYRHSGVRDRSFLTNAAEHALPLPTVKLDIYHFYPSTTFKHVRRFFSDEMKCAGDVAYLLADLCCIQKAHVPTGGVHSEVLAFLCHRRLLDRLSERAVARGGRMTVYVDDIVLTMPNGSRSDLLWAKSQIRQRGLTPHPRKCRLITTRQSRVITGVKVGNDSVCAPSDQHLSIKRKFAELDEAITPKEKQSAALSLLGHLDHVAQIEPTRKGKAEGNRARLKSILKRST